MVKEKKIEGITGLRDESDKQGMRVVIELKRGEVPEVVLNNLYKSTQLLYLLIICEKQEIKKQIKSNQQYYN